MRKIEKLLNIQKSNILTEQRYIHNKIGVDEQVLEEGWKSWVAAGLLTLSTIGGGVKLYQLNQEEQQNRQAQTEYYNKVLGPMMGKADLSSLGSQINSKTHAMYWNDRMTPEDINSACEGYAEDYIQSHPKEFGVGTDGQIYWIPALETGGNQ